MSLVEAVQSGSRRKTDMALARILAEHIEQSTQDRDLAAMSRRLMEVMAELDSLPKPRGKSAKLSGLDAARKHHMNLVEDEQDAAATA